MTNPITCGRVNPDILESDDIAKLCPVSYRTIKQDGGSTCSPSLSRVNPDTIGCVWTGEFDLDTQRVDGEIFESLVNMERLVNRGNKIKS